MDKEIFGIRNFCWLCGSTDCITEHHIYLEDFHPDKKKLLGKRYGGDPTIPLCRDCHNAIEYWKANAQKGRRVQKVKDE